MKPDGRIEAIRSLIRNDEIEFFEDIFTKYGYPPTSLARALGKNTGRMAAYISHPENMTDKEKIILAHYFGVPAKLIYILIERSTLQREEDILQAYFSQRGARQKAKALKVKD